MKIRSITLVGLLLAFVLTPLSALATTVSHIQIKNGIFAIHPARSPAVVVNLYNTAHAKTPCFTRVIKPGGWSIDRPGDDVSCRALGKVVIALVVADPQAFSAKPITIIPNFKDKTNITINLESATQPVFNRDGSIRTPGTVRYIETSGMAH